MRDHGLLISQKKRVIQKLQEVGFTELPNFRVRDRLLKKKNGEQYFGQFTRGTQFTGDLILEINVKEIQRVYKTIGKVRDQIAITIAHEFAHSFVEVLQTYEDTDFFKVLDWRVGFTDDEEEFVELFAEWLIDNTLLERPFFDEFIPAVADGYTRLLK